MTFSSIQGILIENVKTCSINTKNVSIFLNVNQRVRVRVRMPNKTTVKYQ